MAASPEAARALSVGTNSSWAARYFRETYGLRSLAARTAADLYDCLLHGEADSIEFAVLRRCLDDELGAAELSFFAQARGVLHRSPHLRSETRVPPAPVKARSKERRDARFLERILVPSVAFSSIAEATFDFAPPLAPLLIEVLRALQCKHGHAHVFTGADVLAAALTVLQTSLGHEPVFPELASIATTARPDFTASVASLPAFIPRSPAPPPSRGFASPVPSASRHQLLTHAASSGLSRVASLRTSDSSPSLRLSPALHGRSALMYTGSVAHLDDSAIAQSTQHANAAAAPAVESGAVVATSHELDAMSSPLHRTDLGRTGSPPRRASSRPRRPVTSSQAPEQAQGRPLLFTSASVSHLSASQPTQTSPASLRSACATRRPPSHLDVSHSLPVLTLHFAGHDDLRTPPAPTRPSHR
jgi:hypothetical protein